MNTNTRIVVGYDGSSDSDAALAWAARTASLTGDEVVAVIAVDPRETPRGTAWPDSWWQDIEDQARTVLADVPTVRSRIERHVAQPVALLAEAADDASAVVLGSRGHGAAGEIFLGSVSQGVARRARVPVVVVRVPQNLASNRIVVGVDGSEASNRALEFACARAALTSEKVLAMHAWFPTGVALDRYGYVPPVSGETVEQARSSLDEVVAKAHADHPRWRSSPWCGATRHPGRWSRRREMRAWWLSAHAGSVRWPRSSSGRPATTWSTTPTAR